MDRPHFSAQVMMDRLGRRGSLLLGCLGSAGSMAVGGTQSWAPAGHRVVWGGWLIHGDAGDAGNDG